MKRLSLLTALLISIPSWGADKIDQSLPLSSNAQVTIEVPRGELNIVNGAEDSIRVVGTLDELAERLVFEQQGADMVVKVVMPRKWNGDNRSGSKLTVELPKQVNVDASGISTNIKANNFNGDFDVSSVSGELKLSQLSGKLNFNTVSGDQTLINNEGKMRIEAVSGEIDERGSKGTITIRNVSGDIESNNFATEINLETVSGDVELVSNEAAEIAMRSVSGDIELGLLGSGDYQFNGESVSGDLELTVTKSLQGHIRLFANAGGKISNRVSDDKPKKQKYGPSSELEFDLGQGDSKIRMTTLSGTMEIGFQ
ncbi:DUF4097 family beta strand repeat-containing protein [Paraferrimonas haliotis]|uniref:DUF4097 domain-containing protein n=1 Tax=Paraferrimonas haliotis TaxID=2013866 RepID=A0AA37WX04_9GAMM|nr:DUF4097 family beta strand repeat-containing protein [Paraferrimonas haliotis]GLS82909.1 hypothetical protein GCM10007894_08860 [Paraferrimonas haliotis]